MRPATITVPQNIQSLALINRTIPENQKVNVIEAILTTELPGQDKRSGEEALNGLNQRLMQSPRFQTKLTNVKLQGSGSGGRFPEPLSWHQIDSICAATGTDAVISLETFDSDAIITNYSKPVQQKKPDGTTTTIPKFYVEQLVIIKLGFRMYDPKARIIPDQHHYTYQMRWTTNGQTPQQALLSMMNKSEAIKRASYTAGEQYCTRISPSWYSAARTYFKKPGADMKTAARKASVRDWEGAAAMWENIVPTSKMKKAGRAAHNLALANEVMGNLYLAKEWAQKAYSEYNCKQARSYAHILDTRIWEQEKLKEQMGDDAGE